MVRNPTKQQPAVVASGVIEIAAPPEIVWDTITDFDRWPEWNPEVRSMSMSGPVAVGSTFHWGAGPVKITSTIRRVDRPRQIAWTGKTLGIKALNGWMLQPRGDNTIVSEAESFDGLVARLFRTPLQKSLDRSMQSGLQHLKAEAERRTAVHDEIPADTWWTVPGAFRHRPSRTKRATPLRTLPPTDRTNEGVRS